MTDDFERLERASLTDPVATKRMLIIVNPYATTVSDRLKHLVVSALRGRYDVEAIDTQRPRHATELSREAANEGYDVVVAFGGDGTINEAANGLAGSDTPLSCLPGGATNVYPRMLGLPNDVVDATEHLLRIADDWHPRWVDLGEVNGRLFTFAAGAGLDASVVRRVDSHPKLKARYGPMFYTASAIGVFMRRYVISPPKLIAESGGVAVEGVSAFIQNGDPYTFFKTTPIELVDGQTLDSGDLGGVVLERASAVDVPTVMYRALSKRAKVENHRRVTPFAGFSAMTVKSADGREVPVQVDGDYVGAFEEAVFQIRPRALRVIS